MTVYKPLNRPVARRSGTGAQTSTRHIGSALRMIFTLPGLTGSSRIFAASAFVLLLAACTAEPGSDRPAPAPSGEDVDIPAVASEEAGKRPGSAFAAIEGQWAVRSVGNTPFPGNQGIVNFQSETFFSHEAGCGGGHPAFYEATPGGDLRTSRREAVIIGKCSGPQAASLERLLADFIDRASGWSLEEDGLLVLTAADGTRAVLGRPQGPRPELQGEWRVLSIDGEAWDGARAARVTISHDYIGGGAGCNSGGASYRSPRPGSLVLDSMPTTLRRCEDALMQADARLFGALRTVTGYEVRGDRLTLTGLQPIELERMPG